METTGALQPIANVARMSSAVASLRIRRIAGTSCDLSVLNNCPGAIGSATHTSIARMSSEEITEHVHRRRYRQLVPSIPSIRLLCYTGCGSERLAQCRTARASSTTRRHPPMPGSLDDLEKRLWDAADDLRANSGLRSSEYSTPVLGLIFLRYADLQVHPGRRATARRTAAGAAAPSARPTTRRAASCTLPSRRASPAACTPRRRRHRQGHQRRDARHRGRERRPARRPAQDLQPQLDNATLVALLRRFAAIPMDIEGDAFGKIYEYFLGKFAIAEGQKGGEFFTPTSHRPADRRDHRAVPRPHLRPGLRLGRHVRAERRASSSDHQQNPSAEISRLRPGEGRGDGARSAR